MLFRTVPVSIRLTMFPSRPFTADRGSMAFSIYSFLFYFTTVLSHWYFSREIFGSLPVTELRYPTYGAYWVFYCFHNPPNSHADYAIFNNVRKDVNACGRPRGCTDTVRESSLKVDSGRKIPSHTGESNLPRRRAGSRLYRKRRKKIKPREVRSVEICVFSVNTLLQLLFSGHLVCFQKLNHSLLLVINFLNTTANLISHRKSGESSAELCPLHNDLSL